MTTSEEHGAEKEAEPGAPEGARGALLGLCYRLLGSISEAEDAVQEAYVRWYRQPEDDRRAVLSPRSWLMKTAGRICLDMLGSARARREHYVGEWLPEPVPDPALWTSSAGGERTLDPSDRVSLDESVSMALLVVLESMTPGERVAFILHDVFRYPFTEIADIVGRSPEASRKLASSARHRLRAARKSPVDAARHAAVVRSFQSALQTGDIPALLRVLDPSAVAISDGGGIVPAALRPVEGAAAIVRHFQGVVSRQPDLVVQESLVNGEPGLVARLHGRTVSVLAIRLTENGLIDRIWAVRNPQKLRAWS
jgi:RNA polymerase sigma-70 factor (ECF subfamily)